MEAWTWRIGSSLREARFRHWLELAEVEAELEVPAEHLRALEREQFDLLPSDEHVRSTLRAYAEYLGLDPEQYVDEYDSRLAAGKAPRRPGRRRIFVGTLTALAVAGVVAGAGLGLSRLGDQDNERESRRSKPVTRTETETEAISTGSQTTTEQFSEQEQTAEKPAGPAAKRRAQVVLAAVRGNCWLSVRAGSATGKLLYESELIQGDSLELQGDSLELAGKRLWIRFGAASNIDLTLNESSSKISQSARSMPS